MGLRFSKLGPVAVWRDGVALHPGGRQRRAVLARLLVWPNHRVDVEALLEDCWGVRMTAGSRATLASNVSQLRRLLGAERLEGRDHGYLLRVEDEESDAVLFERELEEARRLGGADPRTAAGRLETALARWRGPAMGEFAELPWASTESARLDELHDLATERLTDAVLALGDHERAVAMAERAVREQPLREHRWTQLMLALYRSGRQSEALQAYQRARRQLVEQLGIEPSRELGAIQSAVLSHDPSLDWRAPDRSHVDGRASELDSRVAHGVPVEREASLPVRRTRFFGRSFELIKLTAELPHRRIVTVVGPGGVGKSRMALEAAHSAQAAFGDGCVWVELGRVEDPGEVAGLVATSMKVPPCPDEDLAAAVLTRLSGAERLLVLDNCEHVLEAAAELAERVVSRCPGVTVLATSREPLGISGEAVWTVGPLELEACLELFESRALQADAMLGFENADRSLIEEICERAERIPLAIEIAAAHARSASLADLAKQLPDRLPSAMARSAPPRHRAMSATIEWSWRLLSPDERRLLGCLSVFPADWDLRAAETICDAFSPREVTRSLVGRLADASLLTVERAGSPTRYRMLVPVREFARAHTDGEPGDRSELQRRHCEHYARVAEELGAAVTGTGPNDAAHRFVLEWDNLRAAVNWALAAGDVDASIALVASSGVWALHAMRSEHAEWTQRSVELAAKLGQPSAALFAIAAEWAYWADRREQATQLARKAVRLAPAASRESTTAWVRIAYTRARLDDFEAAAAAFARAERALGGCTDPFTVVVGHAIVHGLIAILHPARREEHARFIRRAAADLDNPLANAIVGRAIVSVGLMVGAIDEALAELDTALESARVAGAFGIETDLMVLGLARLPLRDHHAPAELSAAVARLKTSGYRQLIDIALEIVAVLWARSGRVELARLLLGYLEAQGPLYQHPLWAALRAANLDPIRHDPSASVQIARGAGISQREILDLVSAELATEEPTGSARGRN